MALANQPLNRRSEDIADRASRRSSRRQGPSVVVRADCRSTRSSRRCRRCARPSVGFDFFVMHLEPVDWGRGDRLRLSSHKQWCRAPRHWKVPIRATKFSALSG